MGVDLRGRSRVAEQFLNVAEVSATASGESRRMSQCVRTDVVNPGAEPNVFSTRRPTERVVMRVP
jgi:hypothetical protein